MSDEKNQRSLETKEESGPEPDLGQDGKGAPQSGTETPLGRLRVGHIEPADASERTIWRVIRRLWHWKPGPARYDAENPPKFTLWLNILFGFASCFTVSNLYYNQAILNRIAETFHVSFEQASSVATLMQAGYAGGLLLICPLGDVFLRRPFILGLVAFTATLWLALCLTTSFPVFAAISFLTGLTTVTPQLMLPLVGDLAPAHRRASSLAVVVSGLSLGILAARILSGLLAARTASWRNIYWFGLGAQYLVWALLYVWLPDYPSKDPGALAGLSVGSYCRMLASIVCLLGAEPLLCQAAAVSFLLSAVFTSYWTTLSFLLSSPPFGYSSEAVGLFGLIGVVVILAVPVCGRLVIDKVVPLVSAVAGLAVELAGVVAGTLTGSSCVAGPVVQAVAIDLGSQFAQIANRAAIYGIQPAARNRVNTAYMLAAFSGQLTGTAVGNRLYALGGWVYSGSCSSKFSAGDYYYNLGCDDTILLLTPTRLAVAFIGAALILCLARGPRETGWVGWSGGWAIRRDDLPPGRELDAEAAVATRATAPLETSMVSDAKC